MIEAYKYHGRDPTEMKELSDLLCGFLKVFNLDGQGTVNVGWSDAYRGSHQHGTVEIYPESGSKITEVNKRLISYTEDQFLDADSDSVRIFFESMRYQFWYKGRDKRTK